MMAFQQYQRHLLLFRHQNFLRFRSCRSTTKNQKKDIFSYFRVSRFSSLAAVPSAEVPIITSVVGRSTVRIHNLLHQGCLPYPKTWAYQLYLLNHRLEQRRRQQQHDQQLQEENQQQQQQSSSDNFHDQDCVLLLEHSHVYTLGRGADETHLTFLQQQDDDDSFSSSDDKSSYSTSISAALQKLSRKARGEGTARLTLDRRMEDQMKTMMKNNNSIDHDDDNNDEKKSMLRIIEKLTESISPVVAPNDVPVYRVERGGEGKYSSVCMCECVCVCLCVYTCSYIIFIKTNQSPHLINTKIKYATRKNTVYICMYVYIYIYSHVSWSKTISCISHA